jgi:hypothetical protein
MRQMAAPPSAIGSPRRLSNAIGSPLAPLLPMPRPTMRWCSWPLRQDTLAYKSQPVYPRATPSPPPSAIGAAMVNFTFQPLAPPTRAVSACPRTPCSGLLSRAFPLAGLRAAAAVLPLCRRSPATAPAELPPTVTPWWAQSHFPVACLPARAPPRRRRARHRRRVQGGTRAWL